MPIPKLLIFALGFISLAAANCWAAPSDSAGFMPEEDQRLHKLQDRLCDDKELSCAAVSALFADPRLTLYEPPPPAPDQPATAQARKRAQRNPYLTPRFGLLTPESHARCRTFIAAHAHSLGHAPGDQSACESLRPQARSEKQQLPVSAPPGIRTRAIERPAFQQPKIRLGPFLSSRLP